MLQRYAADRRPPVQFRVAFTRLCRAERYPFAPQSMAFRMLNKRLSGCFQPSFVAWKACFAHFFAVLLYPIGAILRMRTVAGGVRSFLFCQFRRKFSEWQYDAVCPVQLPLWYSGKSLQTRLQVLRCVSVWCGLWQILSGLWHFVSNTYFIVFNCR